MKDRIKKTVHLNFPEDSYDSLEDLAVALEELLLKATESNVIAGGMSIGLNCYGYSDDANLGIQLDVWENDHEYESRKAQEARDLKDRNDRNIRDRNIRKEEARIKKAQERIDRLRSKR